MMIRLSHVDRDPVGGKDENEPTSCHPLVSTTEGKNNVYMFPCHWRKGRLRKVSSLVQPHLAPLSQHPLKSLSDRVLPVTGQTRWYHRGLGGCHNPQVLTPQLSRHNGAMGGQGMPGPAASHEVPLQPAAPPGLELERPQSQQQKVQPESTRDWRCHS